MKNSEAIDAFEVIGFMGLNVGGRRRATVVSPVLRLRDEPSRMFLPPSTTLLGKIWHVRELL